MIDQSSIIKIGRFGELSKSHNIAWVRVKVTCSDDVDSAYLEATLAQVVTGGIQWNTGSVDADQAFECSGLEEVVYVPVRRPDEGFKWEKGKARVKNVVFNTYSDDDSDYNSLGGRTITLR